ncbi:MAG: 2-amino-4-hydroxy-6-hydroxymethyldihydropteridine diphosphokinase [Chitinophagales bacterium]|jgi:2-amino-4-hydroxy-6-hydroxymethyldihydropteridine diphosphokinase|nr:2-amino-4-hydroxy-6-hydroxymethyldihydropteridine diphosphokinase [Sphingobacteriales bacterium]
MAVIHLLLGSNIGNRMKQLDKAREQIESKIGKIITKSRIYETQPWGENEQDEFLNQALEVNTKLKPKKVLEKIAEIEKLMEREETYKWGPREIDIDILMYEDEMICEMDLTIPHPFLHERRFTLIPLSEIAPDLYHPIMGATILDLLLECEDQLEVIEYKGK